MISCFDLMVIDESRPLLKDPFASRPKFVYISIEVLSNRSVYFVTVFDF